jgi:hypothetical protein
MRSGLLPAIAICSMFYPAIGSSVQRADSEVGVLTCSVNAPPAASNNEVVQADSQLRDAICTFRPRKGVEETYIGTVQGLSLSADNGGVTIWSVKVDLDTLPPGLLQQSYAADPAVPADQLAPLVGETNSSIVLHSMADRPEGSASAPNRLAPRGFVVVGLMLRLMSTAV